MFTEKLSEYYTKLEDKYFNALDFLEEKGLPVYAYSDFFEEKGIPSFIVTIVILMLILAMILVGVSGGFIGADSILLSLKDVDGNPLNNVMVAVYDGQGTLIKEAELKSDGDTISLPPLAPGTRLKLVASKEGYGEDYDELMLGTEQGRLSFALQRSLNGINAQVILIDSETGTRVKDATVFVMWQERQFKLEADNNGTYKQSGIPEGQSVVVKATAEGYNPLEQPTIFYANSPRTLSLSPSTQGYVGKASLVVLVNNPQGTVVEGALVRIYNKDNQTILLEDVAVNGSVSGQIQTGIPLRIVVEKNGFLSYDSEKEGTSFTLREKEKQFVVQLKQGGEKLVVNTVNNLGLAMDGALVQLFRMDGTRFNEKYTTIQGAEFSGLDPEETIIITAWKEGYLPQRKIIKVGATESVDLLLEAAIAGNSIRLDVFTTDSRGEAINGAIVNLFDYDSDGNRLPTGVTAESNVGGFVPLIVQTDKTYMVSAETEIYAGQTSVEAIGNDAISVFVRMTKKPKIVELVMIDVSGREIFGTAIVDGLDGVNLYDGNIVGSRIYFNAEGGETVELMVLQTDGNIFTENVYVKGKDYVEVTVYNRDSDEFAPIIEFVGLEDERGETVVGITPGAFYWAKFSVAFPLQTEKGGVHFRSGNNTIEFVDSENVALYELSLQGATNFYSYSYTPTPAPGNEVIDRSNSTVEGEPAKWVEGLLAQPKGTYVAKVKVRVNDFTAGTVALHYRAWANIESDYYRAPTDNDLGRSAYSENKSGLYAETLTEQLKLYSSLPECTDDLCITTNIVDESGVFYDTDGFEALVNNVYALETEISSKESDYVQAQVVGNNAIKFISTQVSNFEFPEVGTESETAGTNISISAEGKQKMRFYFVAKEAGNATIDLSLVGASTVNKQINFKVAEQRKLFVEINPSSVILGRKFTINVLYAGLKGVTDALIKIVDKEGKVVKSISGNNSQGIGSNGNYRVENNLGTGLYTVEVSAPKAMNETVPLLVTTQDVLSFTDEINVKLAFNELSTVVTEPLVNNSEFNISNISFEIEDSEKFTIESNMAPALSANQTTNVPLTIKYTGGVSDSADETITLKISGFVEGKFYTTVSSQVHIIYNRKLDPSCLKIEPSQVTMNILGSAGATDSDTVEVTNNCEQVVYLTHRVREKTKKSYIIVTAQDISLQPGETQNIAISTNNLIDRQYSRDQSFSYEVVFDSNYLKKTLSVTVRTINPIFALSYPGQITMFLAQNSAGGKAIAAQPIFVTNISDFTVEGIDFSIDKDYVNSGGISLNVEPPGAVTLEKRQSITPPKYVFAQGELKDSKPATAKIQIKGRMANLNNSSGQRDGYDYYENYYNGTQSLNSYRPNTTNYSTGTQVLGEINVIVYYSGFDCLTVSATDDLTYNLPGPNSPISKKISITNNCAEPVRVTGALSRAPDIFATVFPAPVLQPNQGAEVMLSVVTIKDSLKLTGHPIEVTAIADLSQTPLQTRALPIDIFVGVDFASQYSKVLKGVEVNVCGQNEKARVDLPKLASGTDCAEGYCDAEQASEYIAKKLDRIIRNAEAQGYSKQNLAENFGCAGKGYCTFSELGIKEDPFDLYLMSDRISTEAIKNVLTEGQSGTTTSGFKGGTISTGAYLIEPFDVTSDTIASVARSGYTRRIFLDNAFSGCGYYKVKIDGAFTVFGGTIQFDSPVIVVRSQDFDGSARVDTKECATNIINLQNHVPIDKGYSVGDDKGSWLTTIESESSLNDIAKNIAKSFLKSESRATSSGPGNKVRLVQAPLTDALAEICISGVDRKTITVKVDSGIMETTGTEQENFKKQISKMVTEALGGNFGEANCLTQTADGYGCLKLTDLTGTGALRMNIPNKTMSLDGTSGCVKAKVISSVAENVEFVVSRGEKFIGVTKIIVKDLEGMTTQTAPTTANPTTNTNVNPNSSTSGTATATLTPSTSSTGTKIYTEVEYNGRELVVKKNESIKLERGTLKEEPYSKEVLICAYSESNKTATGDVAYLQAHDSSFTVVAVNKSAGARKTTDEDGKITISVGTLHPNDLIERLVPPTALKKGKNNEYYFTIMWAGGPEAIIYDEYVDGLKKLQNLDNVVINTEDSGKAGTTRFSELESNGKVKALTWYFGTCMITSGVCNAGTGVIGATLNALVDCGVPAVTTFRTDLVQAIEPLKGTYDFIGELIPMARIHSDPTYQPYSATPIVLGGALGGANRAGIFSALGSASPALWGGVGPANIGWAANEIKTAYSESSYRTLRQAIAPYSPATGTSPAIGLPDTEVRRIADAMGDYASKQATEAMNTAYENGLKRSGVWTRNVTASQSFTEVATQSLSKVDADMGRFLTTQMDPTTGRPFINTISSTGTADDLLRQISSPDYRSTIAAIRTFDTGALENALSQQLESRATLRPGPRGTTTRILNVDYTPQELRQAIAASVDNTGTGISSTVKSEIVDSVYGEFVDPTTGNFKPSAARRFQSGSSIDGIISDVGSRTRAKVNSIDDLFKATSQNIDNIGAKLSTNIADDVARTGDDLAKVVKNKGTIAKFRNLFSSGEFWKGLGMGVFCGAASNAAGMYAYNRSLRTTNKDIEANSIEIADPAFVFIKGRTYKMILSDTELGDKVKPIFSEVTEEGKAEMLEYLSKKENQDKRLVSKEDKESRLPGERKLQLYQLTINPIIAEREMKQHSIYTGNTNLIKTEIAKLIKPETQQLINKYTAPQVLDEARGVKVDNKNRLSEGSQFAKEAHVVAIILQAWSTQEFGGEEAILKELKEESDYIKSKVLLTLREQLPTGVTAEVGEKIFPGKGEEFSQKLAMWNKIEEESKR